ncbi:MAG: teichoic acid D-Ala incorporation-associated protein DltX [Chloroflexi bacterium]|nr:teichoic acid D-Ala incorporation-associated protein DltX [Chloroflexota bacterium]
MTRRWTPSITTLYASLAALVDNRWVRLGWQTLFYLAILVGLLLLYGKGDFSTPGFIYQGF